jgi:hypothetical protein
MANANTAILALFNEVIRIKGMRRSDVDPIEVTPEGEHWFQARYIGDWVVPSDEEDDGDYDWKIPTDATCKMLTAMVDSVSKHFPGVKLTWQDAGEKCWVTFTAKKIS